MTTGVVLCQISLDTCLKKWIGTETMEPEHRLPSMIVGGFVGLQAQSYHIQLNLLLYDNNNLGQFCTSVCLSG